MMSAGRIAGNILTAAGSLMVVSALGLVLFNINSSNQAGEASREAAESFVSHVAEVKAEEDTETARVTEFYGNSAYSGGVRAEVPEEEEPYFEKDGIKLMALIAVPSAGIEIPVCSDFSMELMRSYPCRYYGTRAGGDLVIAAHNYDSHFGRLKNIQSGDEIYLTDAAGRLFVYTAAETEVLSGTSVSDMKSGQWDLTLFTCDLSGRNRITVRCVLK